MTPVLFGTENYSFFDSYWAVVHFTAGIVIGFSIIYYYRRRKKKLTSLLYARLGFVLLLLWEYFEILLRFSDRYELRLVNYLSILVPDNFFELESIINIISDLTLGSIGLFCAYHSWQRRTKPIVDVKP